MQAGQVPMDRAPGRIGFMSTQRRASRSRQDYRTKNEAIMELTGSTFGTSFGGAAIGITAPLMSISWLAWALLLLSEAQASRGAQDRVATNFLLSDHRFKTLDRFVSRRRFPPLNAETRDGVTALPAKYRSSMLHIPKLPPRTRIHPSLPEAPTGERRWAERYDGKGNLHFQHAA